MANMSTVKLDKNLLKGIIWKANDSNPKHHKGCRQCLKDSNERNRQKRKTTNV